MPSDASPWARDRQRSPGHGAVAGPGRAGLGPDPRRCRHGVVGERSFPGVPPLADPAGHVVRERGDRDRAVRGVPRVRHPRRDRVDRVHAAVRRRRGDRARRRDRGRSAGRPLRAAPVVRGRAVAPSRPSLPAAHRRMLDILRAEFADGTVGEMLYVAINLPLSIIEFVVTAIVWTLALSLLTTPNLTRQWGPCRASRPLSGHDAPSSSFLWSRAVLLGWRRPCRSSSWPPPRRRRQPCARRFASAAPGRDARQSRSAVLDVEASELHGSSATSTTVPSSAWSCCRSTSAWRASGSTRIRQRRTADRRGQVRKRGAGRIRNPFAGSRHPSSSTAASCRLSSPFPVSGPCRPSSSASWHPVSGSRLRPNERLISSLRRRWPTLRSTAAPGTARFAADGTRRRW